MFVCGFDIKVSFQIAVEEHYFHIEERDLQHDRLSALVLT